MNFMCLFSCEVQARVLHLHDDEMEITDLINDEVSDDGPVCPSLETCPDFLDTEEVTCPYPLYQHR